MTLWFFPWISWLEASLKHTTIDVLRRAFCGGTAIQTQLRPGILEWTDSSSCSSGHLTQWLVVYWGLKAPVEDISLEMIQLFWACPKGFPETTQPSIAYLPKHFTYFHLDHGFLSSFSQLFFQACQLVFRRTLSHPHGCETGRCPSTAHTAGDGSFALNGSTVWWSGNELAMTILYGKSCGFPTARDMHSGLWLWNVP